MEHRLKDSEWIILKALWAAGEPVDMKSLVRLVQQTQPEVAWNYKTYHTYLRLMCEKGLVCAGERNQRVKLYTPGVTKEQAMDAESEGILSRRGYYSIGGLLVNMAGKLDKKEREELLALAKGLAEQGGEES